MAFNLKTWVDRISEYPTRRTLTKEDGSTELVTVTREEGTVSQEGDAFNAETMNDLETRIAAGFDAVEESIDETNQHLANAIDDTQNIINENYKTTQKSIEDLRTTTDKSIAKTNENVNDLDNSTQRSIKAVNDNIDAVTSRMDAFVDKNNIAISENSIESVNAGSGSWLSNGTTQLSLSPGTYILQASVTFPSNTTGKRQIAIMDYTNSKNYAVQSSGATNGALDMTTTYFMKLTKTTAVRLAYYQNSGSTLSLTSGKIRALKLCDA